MTLSPIGIGTVILVLILGWLRGKKTYIGEVYRMKDLKYYSVPEEYTTTRFKYYSMRICKYIINDFDPYWAKFKDRLEHFVWGNSLNKKEPDEIKEPIKGVFSIEPHDQSDKSFKIFGPIAHDCFIQIAYDDVNHQEVDAQTEAIVYVLNKWWNYSEIQNVFKTKLRENYVKQYDIEKIYEGFTREYPTLQDYLNQWGL